MIELQHIPDEMREADLGSFPLSPGIMTGHYSVAHLYWAYRNQELQGRTITEVFGKENPEPPTLIIPDGHFRLTETNPLNRSVWKYFLDTAFSTRPKVNIDEELQKLISTNAEKDRLNFDKRLSGEKSRIVAGKKVPSLLRAFSFENAFPFKNEFFLWLIPQMARQIKETIEGNFKSKNDAELKALVLMWNAKIPNEPFIPEQVGSKNSSVEQSSEIKPPAKPSEVLQRERQRRHALYRRRGNI